MKPEKILQTKKEAERLQILKDTAVKIQDHTYPKKLTKPELTAARDQYAKDAIVMAKLEAAKKEFMEDWKAEAKPLKIKLATQLAIIRSEVEEITEEVYLMPDHQKKIMNYYTAAGVKVYERPLQIDENQLTLVTGTDPNLD